MIAWMMTCNMIKIEALRVATLPLVRGALTLLRTAVEQAAIIKTKIRASTRLMAALGCAQAEIVVERRAKKGGLTNNNSRKILVLR